MEQNAISIPKAMVLSHLLSHCLHPNVAAEDLMDFGVDFAAPDIQRRMHLSHSALKGSVTETALSFLLGKTKLRCDDRDSFGKTQMQYAVGKARKYMAGVYLMYGSGPGVWKS
jgi:hypothetical protein